MNRYELGQRAKYGFVASLRNYEQDDCILWMQQAFALVSPLPYSRSFHRLLM